MTDKVPIRRLSTGVPGLDAVLGGGLPEFSFNVVAGAPGAGKTTLVQQIMFTLARPDRPALYFTVLGEPPLKMLRYQQQFEFFKIAEVNASVRFVNMAKEALEGGLDEVLRTHRPGSGGRVARDRDRRLISIGHASRETAERRG
jgi:circadian clock protein KaiC